MKERFTVVIARRCFNTDAAIFHITTCYAYIIKSIDWKKAWKIASLNIRSPRNDNRYII